jgi:hypothetical protein
MKFKIINNIAFRIICDKLPFVYPFGKYGYESDIIVYHNGKILALRDFDFYKNQIYTIEELEQDLISNSNQNWRSESRKSKWIEYHTNLVNLMKLYQRDFKIDNILEKENNYPIWA